MELVDYEAYIAQSEMESPTHARGHAHVLIRTPHLPNLITPHKTLCHAIISFKTTDLDPHTRCNHFEKTRY
jgi:hypothetical protein